MSMTLNERNPNVDTIYVGAVGAGVTVVIPALYFRKRSRIKNVYLADTVAIAASGSAYLTASLQDNAGSPVVYATGNTKLGVAALAPLQLALSAGGGSGDDVDQATSPEVDVPAGTMMTISVISSSTAVLTKGQLIIEYYPL